MRSDFLGLHIFSCCKFFLVEFFRRCFDFFGMLAQNFIVFVSWEGMRWGWVGIQEDSIAAVKQTSVPANDTLEIKA